MAQTVALPVPQIKEGIVMLPIKEEQSVDVPMPQMRREMVEVIQFVLVEGSRGRAADQMVDILVPLVMEEIVAVVQEEEKLVPQERAQQRTVERVPGKRQFRWHLPRRGECNGRLSMRQCLRFWTRQSRCYWHRTELVPRTVEQVPVPQSLEVGPTGTRAVDRRASKW